MLLMCAMQRSRAPFELVIKSQEPLKPLLRDPTLRLRMTGAGLYAGFDPLILPRRYGGLCLPMNEALRSGLPVIMFNVSPSDAILRRPCPTTFLINRRQERLTIAAMGPGGVASPVRGGAGGEGLWP